MSSCAATRVLIDVTGYVRVGGASPSGRLNALSGRQRLLNTPTTQKVTGDAVRHVAMAGRGGPRATDIRALQMNINADDGERPGYVGLNAQDELWIFASASTNMLIDVVAYAAAGTRYVSLHPCDRGRRDASNLSFSAGDVVLDTA